MCLVIKIKTLGIREEFSISNDQLLKYINGLDFKSRLDFAIGIDIDSDSTKDQLQMLAAYTNKLTKENLNPGQYRALKKFLENKLKELG